MAKYSGKIGFGETVEIAQSVFDDRITERRYKGDFLQENRRLQNNSSQVNDDLNITNRISIIADRYANQNYFSIKYAEYRGIKWKVRTAELQPPQRIVLTLGDLYNE